MRYGSALRSQGLTLIEILVAMLIGLFLLGGLLQVFTNSKQTYRVQDAVSQLQESGRFALNVLSDDIRMAGFKGCNSQIDIRNINGNSPNKLSFTATNSDVNDAVDYLYDFNTGIQGNFFSGAATGSDPNFNDWTPPLNTSITATSNPPIRGTDVITIRRAEDEGYRVTTHTDGLASLTLASTADFGACDIAIVENCNTAAVFQITNTSGNQLAHATGGGCSNPGNASNDLGMSYVNGHVYKINTITYYVDNFEANDGTTTPTLYRRSKGVLQPVAEGITALRVLYGVDTNTPSDGVANYYVNASQVPGWEQVVSVRLTLSAQTLDDNLGGADANGRITRDFTTTIGLRNRLP